MCCNPPGKDFDIYMTYSQQLAHPNWQRKRNDILNRDKYACQVCESTEKTLHVHHRYYKKELLAWEYPDEALITLCHHCHRLEGIAEKEFKEAVITLLTAGFFYAELLEQINIFKNGR